MAKVTIGVSLYDGIPDEIRRVVAVYGEPRGEPRGDYQRYKMEEHHARYIQNVAGRHVLLDKQE